MAVMRATVLENEWVAHDPTPKQAEFLLRPELEVLYGGAAGGGKSDALLMGALQYVNQPGYAAILFRRTYQDLALPGALIDRAHEWLDGTRARWRELDHSWTFPSGATVTFGYLQTEKDKYRYQSAAFQYIGFDELTQFTRSQYTFLFSRLRRLAGAEVPLRMRSASNPGGEGHDWVYRRLVNDKTKEPGTVFIPAKLQDNPYLDQETYIASLANLDQVTKQQMLDGVWIASGPGSQFRRHWFAVVRDYPRQARMVRFWDLAATRPGKGRDPDWTVGCLMAEHEGQYWIMDMARVQETPAEVEKLVRQCAMLDGREVSIRMEQEPGASGKTVIDHYTRTVLQGYDFLGIPSTGNKVLRAAPLSAAAQNENVFMVDGPWIEDALDEFDGFPESGVDDQVDAASGAFAALNSGRTGGLVDGYALNFAELGV